MFNDIQFSLDTLKRGHTLPVIFYTGHKIVKNVTLNQAAGDQGTESRTYLRLQFTPLSTWEVTFSRLKTLTASLG